MPDEACAVVRQLAEMLAAAHAAGVVHRHVVAENVVVARDGYGLERVKLTGWWLAVTGEIAPHGVEADLAALGLCAFAFELARWTAGARTSRAAGSWSSRGGVKAGTEVTVRFALPLDGRVVAETAVAKWSRAARSDESSGLCAIGVELKFPSPETQRQIDRYVSLMGDGGESTFSR